MSSTADICNIATSQSIYRVAREIKKQEHSAFNCLCSIAEDAAFVNEIRVLYPDLPLVANLRCGLWYTTNPSSTPTCYFKSTDGHQNTLNFSTTRLNWHVAELAAKHGGLLIVDATRKGKRFPDALSKTIPIWIAVINRAVARVRLHDAQKEQRKRSYTTLNGDVLISVADTQTSITVRDEDRKLCQHAATPTTEHESTQDQSIDEAKVQRHLLQRLEQLQQQQQQLPNASEDAHCSSNGGVEHLLLDCMEDTMELLSGLTVRVQRDSMPGLGQRSSNHQSQQSQPSADFAAFASPSRRAFGTPIGSPVLRTGSCLQRSMSLQISPQPSLQEWLDETDVLHRLTAGALYHDHGFSTLSRRAARVSCHSVLHTGAAGKDLHDVLSPAASHKAAPAESLFASSAPAMSCLRKSQSTDGTHLLSLDDGLGQIRQKAPVSGLQQPNSKLQADPDQHLNADEQMTTRAKSAAFSWTRAPAVEPDTPKIGPGGLPSTFDQIEAALQSPTAVTQASPVADCCAGFKDDSHSMCAATSHQVKSPRCLVSRENMTGDAADEFAFPAAHLLVHNASLHQSYGQGSPVSATGHSSTGSSYESTLTVPSMPVVVLNGTSHQPADATSILDIWRSTDLEDVASLPKINDFMPGVYHVPEEQPSMDDDQEQQGTAWHQPLQEADSSTGGRTNFRARVSHSHTGSAAADGLSSSAHSSSSWVDEEAGLDELCAFAPPAEAAARYTAAALAIVRANSSDDLHHKRASSLTESSNGSLSDGGSSQMSSKLSSSSCSMQDGPQLCSDGIPWDTSLHLPLWVPANERQAIEAKLDGFVERLLEIGADVRGLAAQLQKPLRPLWVSQDSLIWTNQVAHPSTLPFTPILLVSASQPHQCERQTARATWWQPSHMSSDSAGPAAGVSDFDVSDEEDLVSNVGMSLGTKTAAGKKRSGPAALGRHKQDNQNVSSWSYVYVPGAGDDEESWACGLTPGLFWDHWSALLSCGPMGLLPAVKQLVMQHKSSSYVTANCSITVPPHQQQYRQARKFQQHVCTDQHHLAPRGCLSSQAADVKVLPAAPGAFWLGRTGIALGTLDGASAADVWRAVDAVLCCGQVLPAVLQQEYKAMQMSTKCTAALPVSAALSSSAPVIAMDRAVLGSTLDKCYRPAYNAGAQLSSSFSSCSEWSRQQRTQAQQQQQVAAVTASTCKLELGKVDVVPATLVQVKKKGGMLTELLKKEPPAPHQPLTRCCTTAECADRVSSCSSACSDDADGSLSDSGSVTSCSSSGRSPSSCSSDGAAGQPEGPSLMRLKWLPIESAKRNRTSLKQHLQEALEFVSAHLAAGHLVLLHDPEGHDTSVCVAVATLLACFSTPPASCDAAVASAADIKFIGPWNGSSCGAAAEATGLLGEHLPPRMVTKHSVRQQLASVSAAYPDARPTRGMLKQVFNFFEEHRRGPTGVKST